MFNSDELIQLMKDAYFELVGGPIYTYWFSPHTEFPELLSLSNSVIEAIDDHRE